MLQNGTADVYATPNASLISTSKETFFKTRIGCMLTLLVLTVISNVLMSAPFESFGLNGASSFILSISMLICSIWWLELDAKIYNFNINKRFRVFLVFLTPVAFIYYSFKTRGLFKGIFLIILSLVTIIAISVIGRITLVLINQLYVS